MHLKTKMIDKKAVEIQKNLILDDLKDIDDAKKRVLMNMIYSKNCCMNQDLMICLKLHLKIVITRLMLKKK
jgi:hypothetical protein